MSTISGQHASHGPRGVKIVLHKVSDRDEVVVPPRRGHPVDRSAERGVQLLWQPVVRSPWHNPFKCGVDGTRDQVIQSYAKQLEDNAELQHKFASLIGKKLQ